MGQRYNVSAPIGDAPIGPMNHSVKLIPTVEGDQLADATEFRSITGAMHYAAHCTRPDVAHSIAELSKHLVKPNITHMQQARKTLAYLLATKHIGLCYSSDPHPGPKNTPLKLGIITDFADASFAEDVGTRRSHTGYVFILNGAAISWSSRCQERVANSTAEAEFRAYNSAGREALFLRKLDYDYMNHAQRSKPQAPAMVWDDNQTTIKWLSSYGHHAKTKHIETAVLPIREQLIEFNTLAVDYVQTQDQVGDVLTKSLPPIQHWHLSRFMLGKQVPMRFWHSHTET